MKRYTVRRRGITAMGERTFGVFDSLFQRFIGEETNKELALARCTRLNAEYHKRLTCGHIEFEGQR